MRWSMVSDRGEERLDTQVDDEVQHHVQQETLGTATKGEQLYQVRELLGRGVEHLTEGGRPRSADVSSSGDSVREVNLACSAPPASIAAADR